MGFPGVSPSDPSHQGCTHDQQYLRVTPPLHKKCKRNGLKVHVLAISAPKQLGDFSSKVVGGFATEDARWKSWLAAKVRPHFRFIHRD
jgi:hypothetical protein